MCLLLVVAVACEDLSEFNRDQKNPAQVPAGALFSNATKTLFDFMTEPNVNINNFRLWAQQWAQTTYADESNYDLITRNVNGNAWNILYAEVIRDLEEMKLTIAEDPFITDEHARNQAALAEIMQVFAYHVLVDIFGDIPYEQAMTDDVTPAYDDDAAIYADLFTRLDAATNELDGEIGIGSYDLIYGGNTALWERFANSLKLRMAIRIAEVNTSLSQTMAEEAVAAGVLMSNDDNFELQYQAATPNTNPLWVSLVQSGRSDYVAAETLVDPMHELNDPRLPFYFRDTYGTPARFVGGVYGDNNAYNAFSHPGKLQETPSFPGIILSYWEVEFLLADAVQRGYAVGGTVEEHYNAGIKASILWWGGTEAAADAYIAQPDVAFATAPGTPFERIALQKWIALYDQGFEAWSTVRFYDYPDMAIAVLSGLPTPTRYTYPVTEYSLNEENVESARNAIGGDDLDTRVFWDVN